MLGVDTRVQDTSDWDLSPALELAHEYRACPGFGNKSSRGLEHTPLGTRAGAQGLKQGDCKGVGGQDGAHHTKGGQDGAHHTKGVGGQDGAHHTKGVGGQDGAHHTKGGQDGAHHTKGVGGQDGAHHTKVRQLAGGGG